MSQNKITRESLANQISKEFGIAYTTAYKKITFSVAGWDGSSTFMGMTGAGTWRQTTAMTGLNFHAFSGNMYADNIIIYGIKS